ncbi:MAG: hypothetical protein WCD11_03010 [Solirubrobacteraceae bacterium]
MFGTSVKSVPGCLVAMAPMLIGVPVAFTPGFGPHEDVVAEAPLEPPPELAANVVEEEGDELLVLPQAASTAAANSEQRAAAHQRRRDPSPRGSTLCWARSPWNRFDTSVSCFIPQLLV